MTYSINAKVFLNHIIVKHTTASDDHHLVGGNLRYGVMAATADGSQCPFATWWHVQPGSYLSTWSKAFDNTSASRDICW
jgi:hypothetical protein